MTKEKIPQIKAKPVFSVEAEAAVLGSLILKNELFDEISTLIHADDFFNYTHKIIFEGIVHLLQRGKAVDILILEQYFTDKSLIDEFGLGYLAQIVNNTPSSSNIVAYAKVIARHSKQRRFAAWVSLLLMKCKFQRMMKIYRSLKKGLISNTPILQLMRKQIPSLI